jgi:hypothetical protein
MDDETIYGPRAYTLTFGSAARQGIISNYKVVISVVDGQEINEFALKHGITLVEGDLIGARWVANQIAVERAVSVLLPDRPRAKKGRGSAIRTWIDRTNDGLSGMPADGISLPPKRGTSARPAGAARRLGYIHHATGRRGA